MDVRSSGRSSYRGCRRIVLFPALLAPLGCWGEDPMDPSPPPLTLRFEGQVTSAENGEPIPRAVVRLERNGLWSEILRTAAANASGWYQFRYTTTPRGCPHWVLIGRADGYFEARTVSDRDTEDFLEGRVSARLRCTDQLQRIDFRLHPGRFGATFPGLVAGEIARHHGG